MSTDTPVLHRDDPDREPLLGHVKVTREDWLAMARDTLVNEGVEKVKILTLADRMDVSRSSFYWYFKNRDDLLNALLDEWEMRNTARIVEHCRLPSVSITQALCNFFLCFIDPDKFDTGLDFAIREWARRNETLRKRVDIADAARIEAATEMYLNHGYNARDADARARILYFMQLGYHALDVRETIDVRMSRVGPYLEGFTGRPAEPEHLQAFIEQVRKTGLP